MVTFSFGWTPLQGLYPAEVLTFENRAKGLSLQAWVTSLCSLINTFGLPPALGKLKYISKSVWLHGRSRGLILVYFIFFGWDLVGFVVIYIFAVETKQVSPVNDIWTILTIQLALEEMSDVFEARNPKKRSFELAAAARQRSRAEREARRA
jgi:hypothetical protein